MSDVRRPDDCLLQPLRIHERLCAGAGPSNPSPRVHAAASLPQVVPSIPSQLEMKPIMSDIRAGIQYGFQTTTPYVFCVTGGGHAAMESMCLSLLEPGEVFLTCENGFWAERIKIIAEVHDIVVRTIKKCYGEVFSVEEIEHGLQKHRPKVLFVVYGESSTGTLQSIHKLGPLCRRYGCLLLVDAVAAMGAAPFYMDKWEIDAVYSGSQKVLNSLTGLGIVALAPSAWEKATNRRTKIQSLFLNATLLAKMWGCFNNQPSYQHSPSNTNIYALREALASLAEEGLEQSWKKHKHCVVLLYKGLEELGLELFVKDPEIRLPSITTVLVPEDVKDKAADIVEYMAASLSVAISMGFSPDVFMWRIGLMGHNATPQNVEKVLAAVRAGLDWARKLRTAVCDGMCTAHGQQPQLTKHLKSCKMSFTSLEI